MKRRNVFLLHTCANTVISGLLGRVFKRHLSPAAPHLSPSPTGSSKKQNEKKTYWHTINKIIVWSHQLGKQRMEQTLPDKEMTDSGMVWYM